MSRVFVCGLGAVSPAGWNVAALREVLAKGEPLPIQALERPGWLAPLKARLAPNPIPRPAFLANPRLRRASPITHYAAAAALEAVSRAVANSDGPIRFGVVVCLQSGCVQYSYRFFEETLKDPATASPLLFPETVFAAPASHVAALLVNTSLVSTIIGDPSAYLQGVALGVRWLEENWVDVSVIIGAEETSWLLADALWHFDHSAVISSGAGTVCLSLNPALSMGVELGAITDEHPYAMRQGRARAAQAMRAQLPPVSARSMLFDGLSGSRRLDAAELAAWQDWTGPRVSAKRLLGEGLMAASAWQCVAACATVAAGECSTALVSLVGSNQQAIGALFKQAAAEGSNLPSQDGPSRKPS